MPTALAHRRSIPRARTVRRTAIVGAASAAAVLLFAGPALAHITVTPSSAPAGSATELTFRVPNEEAKAYTVKVDIQIPTDHPIAQLLVKPVIGWTATVKTITLAKPITTDDGTFNQAVSEVVWSGGKILPGQFQDFSISADPLPTGEAQMTFKALQTYSNGDIVRWIDISQAGQPAPGHPAPVLMLTTSTTPVTTTSGHSASNSGRAAAPASSTDGLSRALGAAGLVLGLLAFLLALMVAMRSRRPAADTDPRPESRTISERRDVAAPTKASGKQPASRRRG